MAKIPIAICHKTNTGELYVEMGESYYALINKAVGSRINYLTEANPFSLGKNVAKLHESLKYLTDKIQFAGINSDLFEDLHGWIIEKITEKTEIRKEIIDYCVSFDELYHSLPKQLIHRDLHGDNMFFENGELSAFIDFDSSETHARLFDLCYCMLGSCKTDDEVRWLEVFENFLSGYNSVSEIERTELEAVPYMFIFLQLMNIAYYLIADCPKSKVDENIEYLYWLYDNRHSFFCPKIPDTP